MAKRLRPAQQQLHPFQQRAVGRTEQAVIADLVESWWQDMLQKPAHELQGWQAGGSPFLGVRIFVAESDPALADRGDPSVADGYSMHVTPQITQDLFAALGGRLAVHHPVLIPQGLRKGQLGVGLARQGHEFSTEDPGQGLHRDQVAFSGGSPLPFCTQAAGRDQAMDMGMEDHGSAPGVQHGEQADLAADIVRIGRQFDQRFGRGFHQHPVEAFLVTAHQFPQYLGHGEDGVRIGDRQQFGLSLCQPARSVGRVALGTAAVTTGVIDRVPMSAMPALGQLAAETLGAAGRNIPQGATMAGQHAPTEPLQVVSAEAAEDVCQLGHGRPRLQVGHEMVKLPVQVTQHLFRQVSVDGDGLGTIVAEQALDHPQVDSVFQQVGGIGMPQGMHRSLLGNAAGQQRQLKGFLQGAGTDGAPPVLAGKQPGGAPLGAPVTL